MNEKELKNDKIKKFLQRSKTAGVMLGYSINSFFIWFMAYQDSSIPESFRENLSILIVLPMFLYWLLNGRLKQDLSEFGIKDLKIQNVSDKERYPDLYKLEQKLGKKLD